MIVRFGNATPVYVKHHGPTCIPECPAQHDELVEHDDGDVATRSVHDGTKERVAVPLADGEQYRVTEFEVAVPADEMDAWLDRAFTSIVDANGGWAGHSDSPPIWVSSDWPALERRLASWFDIPVGEPASDPASKKRSTK